MTEPVYPPTQTFCWLMLHRLPGMTASLVRRLFGEYPDPATWLAWPRSRLQISGFNEETILAILEWQVGGLDSAVARQARNDLDWLTANNAQLLTLDHPQYPALLQEISDPPPWLYVRGDVDALSLPQLAVVGSRHPTRQGEADAATFAAALASAGFAVTSGLAYGIDASAHQAVVNAAGTTVAVLGTGLDVIYPDSHRALAEQIVQRGALVSELPLGSPPLARHFPSRNRIISALSVGVLVVEAAVRSGSLVTARLALEQNREVF
ncbi:MAG: DNA-processing protein DprA, partial [Spongiibacteraceae bacterium]